VVALNELTSEMLNLVRELLRSKRLFGSGFVYDRMDYVRVVINEMRAFKSMLSKFGLSITN